MDTIGIRILDTDTSFCKYAYPHTTHGQVSRIRESLQDTALSQRNYCIRGVCSIRVSGHGSPDGGGVLLVLPMSSKQ